MSPEELDKALEQLYHAARSASSEGLKEEALKKCEEALGLIETYGEDSEHHTYSDFVMLEGDIFWGAADWEQAYQAYHKVALNDPERSDARVAMGVSLFHLCRFMASQVVLEQCSLDEPDDAEVWYYLGLLALRRDQPAIAMKFFREAHELEEDRFFVPVEMTDAEILEIVERMVAEIPEALRKPLENVPIVLEKRPSEELLFTADPPMDPTILGLFEGVPLPARDSTTVITAPDRVILFAENIWLVAHDRETLEEELWITLKHEIGHYLGLSEEDLAERGLS